MPAPRIRRPHQLLVAALASAVLPVQPQTCMARSGAQAAPVVELYTSEGCNSCPPADRWLSALKADPATVALAFHVDYWDSLGWTDRFASAANTQRQTQQQAVNGSRYNYTPQVVVNGMDRKDWSGIATLPARETSSVQISLTRSGAQVTATVQSNASSRLAAYWAVTEDGHSTAVKAGENAGTVLKHDHLVREWQAVPTWSASAGVPATLQFHPSTAVDAAHPRQVNLVVVNADTGRPVQALKLGC